MIISPNFLQLKFKPKTMMGILEGPVTPTLIRDPIRRLCTLVDLARPHGISTTVPLPRFCHMLNDMYELAGVYTKEGNIEKAFVLYLRFVGYEVFVLLRV